MNKATEMTIKFFICLLFAAILFIGIACSSNPKHRYIKTDDGLYHTFGDQIGWVCRNFVYNAEGDRILDKSGNPIGCYGYEYLTKDEREGL